MEVNIKILGNKINFDIQFIYHKVHSKLQFNGFHYAHYIVHISLLFNSKTFSSLPTKISYPLAVITHSPFPNSP